MKQTPNPRNKFILTLALLFVFTCLIIFLLANYSDVFSKNILFTGNFILFIGALISLLVSGRNAQSDNPNKFVRGVMGGTFLKFGMCLVAGIIYIVIYKHKVLWTDVFALMFLYVIYTVVETVGLTKTARLSK